MALSLNTPVGSIIRCIARSDLVGGSVKGDPIKVGMVYTLSHWYQMGYHTVPERRYIRVSGECWVCSCVDFDLVSLPEGWEWPSA